MRMMKWALLLWILALPLEAAAAPAAMVTDVKGKVQVEQAGKWQDARLLQQLGEGARVKLAPGASTTLSFFSDGKRVAVTGPGLVQVGRGQVAVVDGAASVKLQAARKTAAGSTMKPAGITMGAEFHRGRAGFRLGTVGGYLETPVLTWDAHPEATAYEVILESPEGRKVFEREKLEGTRAELPAGALSPGVEYALSVTPLDPELGVRISAPATSRVWVLGSQDAQRLRAARELAEAEMAEQPGDPTPLVIVASQYHRAGAYADALELAQQVREKRPEDPGIYAFLAELYSKLQREQEAWEAHGRAGE